MGLSIRSDDRPQRRYKAFAVECPECGAEPHFACAKNDGWGTPLRGVHRARDLNYNMMRTVDPALWEAKR